jgi:hypothetical protein
MRLLAREQRETARPQQVLAAYSIDFALRNLEISFAVFAFDMPSERKASAPLKSSSSSGSFFQARRDSA